MFSDIYPPTVKVGQAPGTAVYTGNKKNKAPIVTVAVYDAVDCNVSTSDHVDEQVFLEKSTGITWVNVEGLSDVNLIKGLGERFNLHPLTIEDILNVEQRPKVEEFDGYLFVTLKILYWNDKTARFSIEQLSIIFSKNFVLSFQETDTTLFNPILSKLQSTTNQRLRQQSTDYLAYRLIDAVVDQYFVVFEGLGEQLEIIEERIISSPTPQNARMMYRLKREILLLRKAVWPVREALNHLLYEENILISKFTRVYLRDVYDHTMQGIDTIETFREMLSSMLDMYLSSLTIRMNEIMKTLTIITTIFIPITALASIYGMNLPEIPLMKSPFGFSIVAAMMISSVGSMILYFRKKKWI